MLSISRSGAILLAALLLPAAGAAADDLTVSFKFGSADKCSRKSPELKIGNAPAGTTQFKVRLRDNDKRSWRHGGGTVAADASGVIPAGALTDGYNGPCPPSGSHEYEFLVEALDANGDTLAEGSATQSFP
ncbi:hypothetical protein [Dongia sp.]|uniref:hypothetical protein n=1 Tax=Dongia sp. TaxID=1977262 RepID=UPI003752D5C7